MAKSKSDIISERQANLPLPEQPPTASDWNSADERTVNVGTGAISDSISNGTTSSCSLRDPATAESDARIDSKEWKTHTAGNDIGRSAKDGLGGIPDDAVTREKKGQQGLAKTTH